MIDKAAARKKAREYLLKKAPGHAENWAIHDRTLDKPYGWIFFYDHRRYVEEKDRRSRLAGNGPILVENESGAVHQFGTAEPLDFYLSQFEQKTAMIAADISHH